MAYEDTIHQNLEKLGYSAAQIKKLLPRLLKSARFLSRDNQRLSADFFDFFTKTSQIAENLNVDRELVVKAALYDPFLLIRSPTRIEDNVREACSGLGIERARFVTQCIKLYPFVLITPGSTTTRKVRETSEYLGIPISEYLELCFRQPTLFTVSKEKAEDRLEKISQHLGLTKKEFVDAVKKDPALLYKSPAKTLYNIVQIATLLHMTSQQFARKLVKESQEQLLTRSYKTVRRNLKGGAKVLECGDAFYVDKIIPLRITLIASDANRLKVKIDGSDPSEGSSRARGLTDILNIPRQDVLKAIKMAPQIITLDPESIGDKLTALADFLGAERTNMAKKLAREGSHALYQNTDTVIRRVIKSAEISGIPLKDYKEMCIKKPTLLWADSKRVGRSVRLMRAFNTLGVLSKDIDDFIRKKPDKLKLEVNNFRIRYIFSLMVGTYNPKTFGLLGGSRKAFEGKLVSHFGYNPKKGSIDLSKPDVLKPDIDPQHLKHFRHLLEEGMFKYYCLKDPSVP